MQGRRKRKEGKKRREDERRVMGGKRGDERWRENGKEKRG